MAYNKELGDAYEQFTCEDIRKKGFVVYPWKDIPPSMLLDANLVLDLEVVRKTEAILKKGGKAEDIRYKDTGVDALMIDGDGKFVFVQCKCGYALQGVGIHDLNGFFINLVTNPHAKGLIYYTDRLSVMVENLLKRTENVNVVDVKGVLLNYVHQPVALPAPVVEQPIVIAKPQKNSAKKEQIKLPQPIIAPIVTQPIYKLYEHQQKAVNDLTKHFLTNRNAILSYPAGVGKTIISFDLSKTYKYVFILSPCRSHAEQNLSKFNGYSGNNENIKHILISSDGNRNVPSILQLIADKPRCVMSSTFDSADVVNAIIKNIVGSYIVIVDEFHNLSRPQVGVFDYDCEDVDNYKEPTNEMHTLITTATKILFVSATPRVYEMEDIEGEDFNKKLFGENIATMTFNEAIAKKYITNYKIYVPSIGENYDELNKCIKDEIGLDVVGNEIYAKTMFLMKGFRYNGNKKCIMYCRSVEEIKLFQKSFKEMDEFYALNLKFYTVIAETKNRSAILQEFSNDTGYSLIFSIRTLDECIDVDCDSIYISYASGAIVKNVQRVFRCTRINKNNPNKIGFIYVYCDEYHELLQVFSSLKEYDTNFTQKVNVMNAKLGTKSVCESDNVAKNRELVEKYVVEIKEFVGKKNDNDIELWRTNLKLCDEHMKAIGKRPYESTNATLSHWFSSQIKNYDTNTGLMADDTCRFQWDELRKKYPKCFMTREEVWNASLINVDNYMTNSKCRPNRNSEIDDIQKMGKWLSNQLTAYYTKDSLLKQNDIYDKFDAFMTKHEKYFRDFDVVWIHTLQQVEEYVIRENERPDKRSTDKDIKTMGIWMGSQVTKYRRRTGIMKDDEIRGKWETFKQKYPYCFIDNAKNWMQNYDKLCEYIARKNKRPKPTSDIENAKQLTGWTTDQVKYYKKAKHAMKEKYFRDKWEELVEKYPLLFESSYKHMQVLKNNANNV